jgi:hypothetical protein
MKVDGMDRKEIYQAILIFGFGFDEIDGKALWQVNNSWKDVQFGKIARHSSVGKHLIKLQLIIYLIFSKRNMVTSIFFFEVVFH